MRSEKQALDMAEPGESFDYVRAFSRNIGIITVTEQSKLQTIKVAIPGCGGVGGLHALTMARLGVSRFTLADFDTFAIENINRQIGARNSTLGLAKAEVIRREILDINPAAHVHVLAKGIDADNAKEFLDDADVVIDSLDFFAFSARDILFPQARAMGIPVITAAPLGFSCSLLTFTPESMTYEDYFAFKVEDSDEIRALKFAMGLSPKGLHLQYMNPENIDLANGKGPSCVIAVNLCAAMAASEAIKLVLKRGKVRASPWYMQFDPYRGLYRYGRLAGGNRNFWQRFRAWAALHFYLKQGRSKC